MMAKVYFVRHAEPDHEWKDDNSRPLTKEGIEDSKRVTEFLKDIKIDYYISSPYKRAFNTVKKSAELNYKEIITVFF